MVIALWPRIGLTFSKRSVCTWEECGFCRWWVRCSISVTCFQLADTGVHVFLLLVSLYMSSADNHRCDLLVLLYGEAVTWHRWFGLLCLGEPIVTYVLVSLSLVIFLYVRFVCYCYNHLSFPLSMLDTYFPVLLLWNIYLLKWFSHWDWSLRKFF